MLKKVIRIYSWFALLGVMLLVTGIILAAIPNSQVGEPFVFFMISGGTLALILALGMRQRGKRILVRLQGQAETENSLM